MLPRLRPLPPIVSESDGSPLLEVRSGVGVDASEGLPRAGRAQAVISDFGAARSDLEAGLKVTAFRLAQRYEGVRELSGAKSHPLVVWWLSLCGLPDQPDETPWCSAFVNGIAWELCLPRSHSAAARSWLRVGRAVPLNEARIGFDVVVLKRGAGDQPGPAVIHAPGHVGFFAGYEGGAVLVLGGNQGDEVSIEAFHRGRILGIRRIAGHA